MVLIFYIFPILHFWASCNCVSADCRALCCTESITGFVLPGADVESCEEDGVVVVAALPASQRGLPVAETVQCVVRMVVDHQAILRDK